MDARGEVVAELVREQDRHQRQRERVARRNAAGLRSITSAPACSAPTQNIDSRVSKKSDSALLEARSRARAASRLAAPPPRGRAERARRRSSSRMCRVRSSRAQRASTSARDIVRRERLSWARGWRAARWCRGVGVRASSRSSAVSSRDGIARSEAIASAHGGLRGRCCGRAKRSRPRVKEASCGYEHGSRARARRRRRRARQRPAERARKPRGEQARDARGQLARRDVSCGAHADEQRAPAACCGAPAGLLRAASRSALACGVSAMRTRPRPTASRSSASSAASAKPARLEAPRSSSVFVIARTEGLAASSARCYTRRIVSSSQCSHHTGPSW